MSVTAAAALDRLGRDVARYCDDQPRRSAELIADTMRAELARDGGGTFSNAPHMRATVVVRPGRGDADVVGEGGGWTWLQKGTRSHVVRGKGTGRSAVVRTPYGPRRQVTVTGMRAKKTWDRGAARAVPRAADDAADQFARMVR